MIRFSLKCAEGHTFDSWFQSADAFGKLSDAGMVECAVCGGTDVEKAIMAPRLGAKSQAQEPPEKQSGQSLLTHPSDEVQEAMQRLRTAVENNSDYVGDKFATEARAIHDGDAPERSIYGEAKPEEAKQLIEDGVPVLPLPFMPKGKVS